jgi:thiamine biosynthesis protein ThiS
MDLIINARPRQMDGLPDGSTVADLVQALAMQADRVALECNGAIVPRAQWSITPLHNGDRLEVVHFVGGGSR